MRSLKFTILERTIGRMIIFAGICFSMFAIPVIVAAQRIAVLAPGGSALGRDLADSISESFSGDAKVLDGSMSMAAFMAIEPKQPFNMTTVESKKLGSAIGCDFFVTIRADTLRRTSLDRPEYYEAYAAIYAVSSRTGKLISWTLLSFDSDKAAKAESELKRSVAGTAAAIETRLRTAISEESALPPRPNIEELPADGSPEAKNFRAPIPFRRITPEYTSQAFFYSIAATVEIELDLDADGSIQRTEVVRWAGFGLDESALTAVRTMNWRAAERNGKALPMRVLLRYNFKKIDK